MRPPTLRCALKLALAAGLALAVPACQPNSEGEVRVLVIGDSPDIGDPSKAKLSTSDALLLTNVAQGLVRFDARGQVEPGLAETWNVSDDGLSYIFRLASTEWPGGRKVTAERVSQLLRRQFAASKNPLRDALGVIQRVQPMTERVLEIQLSSPRPEFLQLLAQPELALVYRDAGTGPFALERGEDMLRLSREVPTPDEEETRTEVLELASASAQQAIRQFVEGEADLVLGGTFADLPYATSAKLPRGTLHFDPASGLFGLMPVQAGGLLSDPEVRQLLSQAIDRDALIAALAVPGLTPRSTVLEPGLSNVPDPTPPAWMATALADRRPELVAAARRLFAGSEQPTIRLALPEGPGSEILLDRLRRDWGALGLRVERSDRPAGADLKLVDEVAASASAAWFVRHFRCGVAAICDEQVDELLEAARSTVIQPQRSASLLEASRRIDALQLFMPIAAPIRWALVANRISGFSGNRFARHTLTGLEERLSRGE